ncbi:unnamed protein product [Trichogramma brassicae]|uniref:Rel homology dimerisation domain-containing protein n=1 Tax=Trichogramma brassicae TaxID=86971 RepID=A0A6H5I586_9HYME|nr:unnamed protein product [Trichogramma brassicae]
MNFFKTRLKLAKLKSLRKKFNLEREDERGKFLRKLEPIIDGWFARLPDLRDIFSKEEIESLLSTSANHSCAGRRFILFVVRTGYKDEPEVDDDGKPLLHRTTPLLRADDYNIVDFYRLLFEIYDRYDVNYTDESGCTHFHIAVKYKCNHVVEKFLELGQDPNVRVRKTGDLPLHLALSQDDIEMVKLLLRNGADPNLSNYAGSTLHLICNKHSLNMNLLNILIELSHDKYLPLRVYTADRLGNKPLHLAIECQNKEMIEWLLRNGANPNFTNNDGLTPLHVICMKSDYNNDLAEIFFNVNKEVNRVVKVDKRDNKDRTALQLAVANFLPQRVSMLLDHGADLFRFVFPGASYFGEIFEKWLRVDTYKLRLSSGALAVVESLEDRGYQLNHRDAMMIMKFFDNYELFEKSAKLDESWYKDKEFLSEAKKITIRDNDLDLSLYDLVRLPPEEEENLLTSADYLNFWYKNKLWELTYEPMVACQLHLSEKMARGFFRRWALDPFLRLTRRRIPILCCEIILKNLKNEDLFNICLAAEIQRNIDLKRLRDFIKTLVDVLLVIKVGISFRTPAYHDPMIDRTVHAYVQLRRPSDGMTSESIQFNFLPSGRPGNLYSLRRALARKSFNNDIVSDDVTFNNNINVNRYLMDINLESKVRLSPLRPSQKCTLENRASQTSCTNLNNENTIVPDFNKAQNEWLDCNDVNRWVEQSQEAIVKLPCADELETASLSNSAADQCLDELLSQVVELDKIYEDTQAKLMNDQHEAMEIQSDVRDDQTYTSLQLAMKNPLWVNQEAAPSQEPFNKEQTPPTPPLPRRDVENKVPPLPPKRIRKTPSMPVLTNQMFYAPNKTLPSSPKLVTKPGLFSKLFSRKPKKDASYPNNGLTGIANNTIRCESMPPVRAMARLDGDETPPYGAELTDVEHYALYTAMAPRATDSEFDEMSFYYSPVEGGKILLEAKQTG